MTEKDLREKVSHERTEYGDFVSIATATDYPEIVIDNSWNENN